MQIRAINSLQHSFERRGIVEGFYGAPWSQSHRRAIFDFGAHRGMNTYLYAPKDDPFHRERWRDPYPPERWSDLCDLIRLAHSCGIDFAYAFHPGKGLHFSAGTPIEDLLAKAKRLYAQGVQVFAVLFDDIPSRLQFAADRREFKGSLAKAEALWLRRILDRQPSSWNTVEWWLCPSYYSEDPVLEALFGRFEPGFLETVAEYLPESVACLWTGPSVVSEKIRLTDIRRVARRLQRRLIIWDNYPVNDLAMRMELHLSPLSGRDPRLCEEAYGYLNNPLLQEALSFIPLGTCFDYASAPFDYDPEKSWGRLVAEHFGAAALPHWRALRSFCEKLNREQGKHRNLSFSLKKRKALREAYQYVMQHESEQWFREFRPWRELLERALALDRSQ